MHRPAPADQTDETPVFARTIRPRSATRLAALAAGTSRRGLDFASSDPLGLATHPALRAAATAALSRYRPVGPGPGEVPPPVTTLQDRLARFLTFATARTFPSAPEAARAAFATVLRPCDHVIVDAGADPTLVEAVRAARATVHRCPPGSVDGIERRLRRLSRLPGRGRLVVAVPAVSAFTSVCADLLDLVSLCDHHDALLVVDASHDLGTLAQDGRGVAELSGCLGQVDIILGSLSPGFGVTGGFAAFRDPDVAARLRPAQALSVVLAAAALAALDLVDSPEGRRRRRRLHGNSLRLRNHLMADGLTVLGQPTAVVPVPLPLATAEARTAMLRSAGPDVPLLAAPDVARHAPRWLIRLSSDHSPADVDDLAELIRDVARACDRMQRGQMQITA